MKGRGTEPRYRLTRAVHLPGCSAKCPARWSLELWVANGASHHAGQWDFVQDFRTRERARSFVVERGGVLTEVRGA